jgi:hypothetical protein
MVMMMMMMMMMMMTIIMRDAEPSTAGSFVLQCRENKWVCTFQFNQTSSQSLPALMSW